jgi:hypothetical protein
MVSVRLPPRIGDDHVTFGLLKDAVAGRIGLDRLRKAVSAHRRHGLVLQRSVGVEVGQGDHACADAVNRMGLGLVGGAAPGEVARDRRRHPQPKNFLLSF